MLAVTGRATVYLRNRFGLGVAKTEVTNLAVAVVEWAQYQAAVTASWVPKGCRRMREMDAQCFEPSLVVLEGWGHPDPDGIWDESTKQEGNGVTTMRGRYSACDVRWQSDFDAKLAAYLAAKPTVRVLADYRGHDTQERR